MLKAARQAGARDVIAVVQPHRYTRLHSLFDEFCTCMNDAGTVIVADVYAAGEAPIAGMTRDALVDGLRARGHRSVVPLPSPARLAEMVFAIAGPATSWCAWAPATSRNGPQRCRRTWPRCSSAVSRAARHDGRRSHPGMPRHAAEAARSRAGERTARAVHLVPRRRPRRGAGAARRRGGPRAVPARAAARGAGARDRRLLQPDRARWRAAGRGDPAGARVRHDRRRRGRHHRRRRRARRDGGRARRRGRTDRAGVPVRHSRQHRRRGGDERRRLRQRRRVLPRLGRDRHAQRRATPAVGCRPGVRLSAMRGCRTAPWWCGSGCARGTGRPR